MTPIRGAFRHWKSVEPYEFRLPVPEPVVEAMIGLSITREDWLMAYFLTLFFHHRLRPAEALALEWCDIIPIWDEPMTYADTAALARRKSNRRLCSMY